MEEEDKEFFILVLGVLAAILLVISWWFTTGGISTASTGATAPIAAVDDHGDDDHSDDDADHDESNANDVDEPAEDAADEPAEDAADEPAEDAADEEEAAAEPEEAVAATPAGVFDAIAGDDRLGVLAGLLRDEGLDAALAVDGPFTVFGPTDDAISNAAASDTTVSILEQDRSGVLTYHVLPGSYSIEDLTDIARGGRDGELVTVQGEPLELSLDGDTLLINGAAAVDPAGTETANGVVYTLDNLLVPPVAGLNAIAGLEPILFATGSAEIDAASFATLDQFVDILGRTPVSVTIEGHTDNQGDELLNQNLSEDRARSVLNYLVAAGVDEGRLSAQGFGSSDPVADNATEEGRALNRRIEFSTN